MQIYNKRNFISNHFISVTKKTLHSHVRPHGHDFFEIEFILNGEGTHLIDGVSYPIAPNALFLLTPASVHEIRTQNVELITIMFQSEYDGDFFSFPMLSMPHSPSYLFSGRESRLIREQMEEIYQTHTKDSAYAMMQLYCVLHKLQSQNAESVHEVLSTVQHIIAYILEHFREELTLRRMADHFNFSPSYLSELFLRETGIHFKEYLDSVRFSHAQNLLAFTDLPIHEVHVGAGVADYANFARRFKARTGMTPGEYRRRMREKGVEEIE